MDGWLDRLARRAASPPAPAGPVPQSPGTGHPSRRAFLKRAAVAAGAAWSVPILQSVVAPAAAASGPTVCSQPTCGTLVSGSGPCLPCATGQSCGSGADCLTGICTGGLCAAGPVGTPCSTAGDCTGGRPCSGRTGGPTTCGGPGAGCGGDGDCHYGNCTNSVCGYSAAFFGATCGTPTTSTTGPGQTAACSGTSTCRIGITGQWRCRP